jgi:hypothetical protein
MQEKEKRNAKEVNKSPKFVDDDDFEFLESNPEKAKQLESKMLLYKKRKASSSREGKGRTNKIC